MNNILLYIIVLFLCCVTLEIATNIANTTFKSTVARILYIVFAVIFTPLYLGVKIGSLIYKRLNDEYTESKKDS